MGSPTAYTKEQTLMNNTQTSDWKSKLSPRARGRIQIALPGENTASDFNQETGADNDSTMPAGDLSIKKEFAQTGNFPPRKQNSNFGIATQPRGDQLRKTVYNQGNTGSKVTPND